MSSFDMTTDTGMTVSSSTTILAGEPGENGPLYTRVIATNPGGINAGALLMTAEVYRDLDDGMPAFPIYRSADGGESWELATQLRDERLLLGHRHQPVIYELPASFAGLPAGALLLAGSAIPRDMSTTSLVLYSSVDTGSTWAFHSIIDRGGPAVYDPTAESTTTAVWEPDLMLIGNRLACYYADERYKAEGMLQTIVRRWTTDLNTWTDRELIKGVPDASTRPGMWVSTGEMPDGRYRAVMEVVGPKEIPDYWLTSEDGVDWGDPADLGERLISDDGISIVGTPNVHWKSDAAGSAIVIATGRLGIDRAGEPHNVALINRNGGIGPWQTIPLPTPAERQMEDDSSGYSQSLTWNASGQLVQATTVRNEFGSNDIVVTVAPMTGSETHD
jgi:hypothetical protein